MKSSSSNSEERERCKRCNWKKDKCTPTTWHVLKGSSHILEISIRTILYVRRPRLVEIAFRTFFGEEHQTFRKNMFHNLDQLQLQFERENLHEVNAKDCLKVLRTQFKKFFASNEVNSSDRLNQIWQENFKDYTGCESKNYKGNLIKYLDILEEFIDKRVLKYGELRMKESEVKAIKETKKWLNEAILHEHEIEKSLKLQSKDVQINTVNTLNVNSVVMEDKCYGKENNRSSGIESEKHDTSSRSENNTHNEDADIRPATDKEPMAEVQVTSKHNILANGQQHAEQPKFNNEEKVDQDVEQCQVKNPLLDAELFKKKYIVEKEVYNKLSNRFSRLEKHYVSLEISIQKRNKGVTSDVKLKCKHGSAWGVLKDHHKWRGVKAVVPGRCVRTTEDIEDPNDTISRPPGKCIPRIKNPTRPNQQDHLRRVKKLSRICTEGMTPEDAANIEKFKDEIRAIYFGAS
ncbi:hypothetical protein Tco_0452601 [Tanacetum coccineum]